MSTQTAVDNIETPQLSKGALKKKKMSCRDIVIKMIIHRVELFVRTAKLTKSVTWE